MTGVDCETTRETYQRIAADADIGDRIPVEVRTKVTDPFEAYTRVRTGDGFFLETTGGQSGWGYFGVEPSQRVTARQPAAALESESSSTLAGLVGILDDETLRRGNCEIPYPCGLFGWFSYDLARELESLPDSAKDDRALPHLECGLFDRVVSWREPRPFENPTEVSVTACPRLGSDVERTYDRALERATSLAEALNCGDSRRPPPPAEHGTGEFRSDCGAEAYAERVRKIKEYIREGDTFQVNVSHRLRAAATVDAVTVYEALRRVNPAPYSGLMELREVDLVSASPELLLHVDGEELLTEPIAGTRPRGTTEAADAAFEAELTGDEKERAEHAMLVDLERNDLGKVSRYGTVDVREYRRVDRYSEVMHLVSLVEGELRDDVSLAGVCRANPLDPADTTAADRLCAAIAAVFPGGTITGAPKPRTMEIIEELESTRRGPYTGSMAAIGFDRRATLNIVIRTLVRVAEEYHLRVGAGIVHDSVPEQEYEETIDKARALINAVNEALAADGKLEVRS